MTTRETRTSGTSKPSRKQLPTILKYPTVHPFSKVVSHLRNHLCYILRRYENDGIAALIIRQPKQDNVTVVFGDWAGNTVDLAIPSGEPHRDAAVAFASGDDLAIFVKTMQLIKLEQAQFFFSFSPDGLILTDIQISLNKLAGPGMVRDIFGKSYRVPEIIKIEVLDDRAIEYIEKGTGSYEGDLTIKPSKFSMFNLTKTEMMPLYAEVRR